MSVKSDIRKFKTYKEQVQFTRGITSTIIKVLLIGSDQFKQDVLGNTKEIRLKKNEFYEVCICEEDYIKELNKYTKKIKNNIFVVSNNEESELTLQYKYPSMDSKYDADINNIDNDSQHNFNYDDKQNNCKQNCDKCNQEDSFEEQLADFIEEYAEVIEANPSNIRDILYEFYGEVWSASHLQGKMDVFNYLSEDIQNNVDEINNYYGNENNGNGYIN